MKEGAHAVFTPEKIVIRHVRMKLRTPFVTALGVEHVRDIVIVEVHADGLIGYGEVPVLSGPTYNEETVDTAWHVLNDFFVERILKVDAARSLRTPGDVARGLSGFRGHRFAKAGLEGAVWDVTAKQLGMSLSEMLYRASDAHGISGVESNGDGPRTRIPSGVVVGMPRSDAGEQASLLQRVEARLAEGYRRIKIKIEPDRDARPLRAIRRTFGDIALAVDANGAYDPQRSDIVRALDEFELSYIEQPLPAWDIVDHARLQRGLRTPVCLDESVGSAAHARQALDLGSCRALNIKASRVGGLAEALHMHDLCFHRGVPALCGGLLESGIGRAHNVALASLPGFSLPGDISASTRYWERDIVEPLFELDAEGYIPVPEAPGIGVEVDRAYLERLTVREFVHHPA